MAIRPELTTFGKLQLAFKGQRRCIGFRIWCKMKTPLQAGARCNQLSYDVFGHDLVLTGSSDKFAKGEVYSQICILAKSLCCEVETGSQSRGDSELSCI